MGISTIMHERFWAKVNKTAGCWLWTGARTKYRYGYCKLNRKHILAHRIAYELCVGPIPAGLTIDHVKARGCTNRNCVNPAHLEAVTSRVNTQRGGNAIKTHCRNGHAFSIDNTWIHQPKNTRYCITCKRRQRTNSARRCRARSKIIEIEI